jgi:sarcosine oxidase, subunit gamma
VTGEAFASVAVGAQIDLRLDPAHVDRLPFRLPREPNHVIESGDRSVLWLGPDEWLIVSDTPPPTAVSEIDASLAGVHHSAVDVSANRVALDLSVPSRLDLLSAGCGLDLHPRSWGPGRCAQTLVARVPVILWERGETTRVLVRPSFAPYLMDWLTDQKGYLT